MCQSLFVILVDRKRLAGVSGKYELTERKARDGSRPSGQEDGLYNNFEFVRLIKHKKRGNLWPFV